MILEDPYADQTDTGGDEFTTPLDFFYMLSPLMAQSSFHDLQKPGHLPTLLPLLFIGLLLQGGILKNSVYSLLSVILKALHPLFWESL